METSTNHNDFFLLGMKAFFNDNFSESVRNFSQILKNNENDFQTLLYRSSSLIKLGKYTDALKDLELAEKINSNSFELYYKKGIVVFNLENYLEANDFFKKALTLATYSEQREKLVIWSNKLEIELEENNLLNKDEPLQQSKVTSKPTNIKIISNWFQTGTHITVTLDSNSVLSQDSFNFILDKKAIKIVDKESSLPIWEMNLSNSIDPLTSTFTTNNKKVEFRLHKEVENFNWVTVDRAKITENTPNFQPSYPTSAKVKKDWNNLEKEITQELKNDAKNDPNQGMMTLFRDIFGNANEDTRRAMIKSFQTSGGTVLSTNWDEVKEKDYEGKDKPEAPKGQEWRKNNDN